MKKSVLISVILLLVVCIATSVNAYSTSDYSIDVPASFKQVGTGAIYKMTNGNNFNVQITNYDEKKDGYPYTQKNLEDLAQEMEKSGAKIKKKEIRWYVYETQDIKKRNESYQFITLNLRYSSN